MLPFKVYYCQLERLVSMVLNPSVQVVEARPVRPALKAVVAPRLIARFGAACHLLGKVIKEEG